MRIAILALISVVWISCRSDFKNQQPTSNETPESSAVPTEPSLIILGNVQDAGSPHIACAKDCCKILFSNPDVDRKVVSLGLIDPIHEKKYLFEATPDIPEQMKVLMKYAESDIETPDGIFLTHAHIGHYTGLMYLGKEAMGASDVPVYAMPRMKQFLSDNGPWSQLVANNNININDLKDRTEVNLSTDIKVIPFLVPHRDEYSETVGYKIVGPNKSVLFIPDIDKWEKWDYNIVNEISEVDYAFLDATFYDASEINNRNISEIPHPFIIESMKLFEGLTQKEKAKIHFIHLNHTNGALDPNSHQSATILKNGFHVARINDVFQL